MGFFGWFKKTVVPTSFGQKGEIIGKIERARATLRNLDKIIHFLWPLVEKGHKVRHGMRPNYIGKKLPNEFIAELRKKKIYVETLGQLTERDFLTLQQIFNEHIEQVRNDCDWILETAKGNKEFANYAKIAKKIKEEKQEIGPQSEAMLAHIFEGDLNSILIHPIPTSTTQKTLDGH